MQLGRILLNPIDKDVNVRGLKIANTIQLEIVDSQSVGLSLPEISMRRDPYTMVLSHRCFKVSRSHVWG